MGFNNGYERRKFEEEWKKLRVKYTAAGMDEAAIEEMYQFDLSVFKSNRRYGERRQDIPLQQFEGDGDAATDGNFMLVSKFFDSVAVMPQEIDSERRFGWVDEIESEELSTAIRKLSQQQIEILTLIAFEGYNATEAGKILGLTQQGVSWHICKIKKILKNFKNNL